jgi:predicted DsbA family dithiol-disulfide isomerase
MPEAGELTALPEAVELRFYYDVVCPYSYMESHLVEQAQDAGRASVTWLPFELRPAPRPLLDPRGDHLRVDWTRTVYQRAQALGVEIHLPRYQPRSTLPLAACLWAGDNGRLREFRRALYEAFFCEGRDISDDAELARAAQRAGLNGDGAIAAAYSPAQVTRLGEVRAQALKADVRGVPSVLTRDGATHWGMGGLQRVLDGEPLVPRPV